MHGFTNAENFLTFAFLALISSMSFWFRDVISEATYLGNHTLAVQRGLNMGVALFIVSEALFFLALSFLCISFLGIGISLLGLGILFLGLVSSKYFRLSPKPHTFTSLPLQSKISISLNIFPFDAITRGLINFYNILTIPFFFKTLKNSTIFKVYISIFASILLLLGFEPFTISLNISILLILYYTASFYVRYKFQFDMWITGLTVLVLTLICLVIFWKLLFLVLGYALELTTILSISTVSSFLLNYELCMNPGDPGSNGGEGSSSGGAGGPPGGPSGGGLPDGVNTVEEDERAKNKAKNKVNNDKARDYRARENKLEEYLKSEAASEAASKRKQDINNILNVTQDGPKHFEDADLSEAIIKIEMSKDRPNLDFLKDYRASLKVLKKGVLDAKPSLDGQDKIDAQARADEYKTKINEVDWIIWKHTNNN